MAIDNRNFLAFKQKLVVKELLDKLIDESKFTLLGDDMVSYADGVTDETVAKRVAGLIDAPVTSANVAGVRKEMFGTLSTAGSGTSPGRAEIAQMKEQVEQLDKQVDWLVCTVVKVVGVIQPPSNDKEKVLKAFADLKDVCATRPKL